MKRSRFSEEQIIGILKEHQAELGAKELCRKHGISEATFYKWRSKFGGMEVSDAQRLKTPESKTAKTEPCVNDKDCAGDLICGRGSVCGSTAGAKCCHF